MNKKFDILKSYQHILLCFDHANSLGLIRSIGREGINPVIVLVGGGGKHSGLKWSRYAKQIIYVNTHVEGLNHIISNYSSVDKKAFLYIMDDKGMAACEKYYGELKDKFYFFNTGDKKILSHYLDKVNLCNLAKDCGLNVPAFERIGKGNFQTSIPFPVFIKSSSSLNSGWKKDMYICYSENDFLAIRNRLIGDSCIVQSFIKKKTEDSFQGISLNGGESVYLPYKKRYIRLRDNDYGTYMTYSVDVDQCLIGKIQMMLQRINYSGVFEIEFIVDDDNQYHFLEINFRFSASNQGMQYGGVNLPLEWAKSEIEGRIDTDSIELKSKPFIIMNEKVDFAYFVLGHRMSFVKWLHDFFAADSYYIWDAKDPLPIILSLTDKMKRSLQKFFRG